MARLFSFLELSSWGLSMALPGNDDAIRDQRRERVARLYVSGKSQRAIAVIVGVSQPTVSNDLEEIRKQWLSDAKMNFAERQAKELAKIDAVEAEAWDVEHAAGRHVDDLAGRYLVAVDALAGVVAVDGHAVRAERPQSDGDAGAVELLLAVAVAPGQ